MTNLPGLDQPAHAETLPKALKGLGTHGGDLPTLLASRSDAQRQEILAALKTLFGRDPQDDLKSELTGKFQKLMVALRKPLALGRPRAGTTSRCRPT